MIPLFKVFMAADAKTKAAEVLNSGFIGQGKKVEEFEKELRNYFESPHAVTTNSATSAEHLALHILKRYGLEPGDEVLATPLTCSASNWPIIHNGFKIKWVDVDPLNCNMNLFDLERKMTPKTKAIMGVHWSGIPLDMDKIDEIREKAYQAWGFRPHVIYDCAHALGSFYKGRRIGTKGINTFSFQAIKHLTTVDGGAIVTDWDELAEQAVLDRWYGISRDDSKRSDFRCEEDIKSVGFKFHMNDVNASVGLANIKHLDFIVGTHKRNAAFYDSALDDLHGLTLLTRDLKDDPAFWIYSMLVDRKPDFMRAMKDRGVMTSQVHERNDKHTCMKEFKAFLPGVDTIIPRLVHIPVGWWVSPEDREYIVDAIKKGW